MKHSVVVALLLLIVPLTACAGSLHDRLHGGQAEAAPPAGMAMRSMSMGAQGMLAAEADLGDAPAETSDRLLRKSASLGIEVAEDEVESSAARAEQIIRGAGGTTESSNRGPDGAAQLDFRVPSERLEETLEALEALGEPTHRSSHVVDVTAQAIDLEAKIENLRGLRDRLRALLDRATKVEEILQIERELNRVQTQLDAFEGQQKRLLKDVAMSTLSLRIEPLDPPRILGPLGYLGAGLWWVVEKLFVIRY